MSIWCNLVSLYCLFCIMMFIVSGCLWWNVTDCSSVQQLCDMMVSTYLLTQVKIDFLWNYSQKDMWSKIGYFIIYGSVIFDNCQEARSFKQELMLLPTISVFILKSYIMKTVLNILITIVYWSHHLLVIGKYVRKQIIITAKHNPMYTGAVVIAIVVVEFFCL